MAPMKVLMQDPCPVALPLMWARDLVMGLASVIATSSEGHARRVHITAARSETMVHVPREAVSQADIDHY